MKIFFFWCAFCCCYCKSCNKKQSKREQSTQRPNHILLDAVVHFQLKRTSQIYFHLITTMRSQDTKTDKRNLSTKWEMATMKQDQKWRKIENNSIVCSSIFIFTFVLSFSCWIDVHCKRRNQKQEKKQYEKLHFLVFQRFFVVISFFHFVKLRTHVVIWLLVFAQIHIPKCTINDQRSFWWIVLHSHFAMLKAILPFFLLSFPRKIFSSFFYFLFFWLMTIFVHLVKF